MTKARSSLASIAVFGTLGIVGCQNEPRSDAPPTSASVQVLTGRMDDAMKTNVVLRALHAGNLEEIEVGKLAEEKGQSPEVKKFATEMVIDHTAADQKLGELAKRMSVDVDAPPQDPVQAAMAAASEERRRALRGMPAMQFDAAYVVPQAGMHEFVLKLLDEGERAATGEAKKFLAGIRPTVEMHRDHARVLMRGVTFVPSAVGGGPMNDPTQVGGVGGGVMKGDAAVMGGARHDAARMGH
ncbi:MAG TPA: DUF4142 domain-containing protein [Polyangiaceae bacterium]|nr:DUF4142 domain-containing protein [Polyangiaceae bacterium]